MGDRGSDVRWPRAAITLLWSQVLPPHLLTLWLGQVVDLTVTRAPCPLKNNNTSTQDKCAD
jgi:hypothetical protein